MRNQIRIIFILTSIFLASVVYTAFMDYGWGVRPEGMAGAFTSISDDANAIFYNPSGLAQVFTKEANLMYTKPLLGLDGIDIFFMHGVGVYPASQYGNFGLGITQYSVNGSYSENTIIIGYGYDIARLFGTGHILFAGINLKYLTWSVQWDEEIKKLYDSVVKAGNSKSGFGVDFGILAELVRKLRVGFLGRNLNSPDIGLYYEEKLPSEYRFGFGYNFGDLGRLEDFAAAVDVSYRQQAYAEDSNLQYSVGVETWLNFHTFGFRVGFNKTDITTGVSYYPRLKEGTIRLKIDYALLISTVYTESMGSHKISFGVEF